MNDMQVGCHLEVLYATYLKRLELLIAHGAKEDSPAMPFSTFKVLWGKWCDRYIQGAASSPEAWGDCFLEHEFGPLV